MIRRRILLHCPKRARESGQYICEDVKIQESTPTQKRGRASERPVVQRVRALLFPSILQTEQQLKAVGLEQTRKWGEVRWRLESGEWPEPYLPSGWILDVAEEAHHLDFLECYLESYGSGKLHPLYKNCCILM